MASHEGSDARCDVGAPGGGESARRIALVTVGLYLAWSAVLLAAAGHVGYAVAHAIVICVVGWATASRQRIMQVIGDFAPLLLMPLLYTELPQLMAAFGSAGGVGYHDAAVQRLELAVFGGQPAHTLAGAHPIALLSEILHAGYLAYYPAVFVPALVLYARGERRGFAQTVLTLTLTYAVCWVTFALYPVEGPRYQWSAPPGVPDGMVRRFALMLLAGGSSRGAAFPSSHMAISAAQAVIAWRWQRGVAQVLCVVAVLVGFGAVYGGFHYGVDMLAGAVCGVTIGLVVAWSGARQLRHSRIS